MFINYGFKDRFRDLKSIFNLLDKCKSFLKYTDRQVRVISAEAIYETFLLADLKKGSLNFLDFSDSYVGRGLVRSERTPWTVSYTDTISYVRSWRL